MNTSDIKNPHGVAVLCTDGAARGNPGPAGAGMVLSDGDGNVIAEAGEYLGETTNNVAEYSGLIKGLALAARYRVESLKVYLDSELVVRQLTGVYKVKNAALKPLFDAAREQMAGFKGIEIKHVPREENRHADRLANTAIDRFQAGELSQTAIVDGPGQASLF